MAEETSVMQVIPKLVDFIEWIITSACEDRQTGCWIKSVANKV